MVTLSGKSSKGNGDGFLTRLVALYILLEVATTGSATRFVNVRVVVRVGIRIGGWVLGG